MTTVIRTVFRRLAKKSSICCEMPTSFKLESYQFSLLMVTVKCCVMMITMKAQNSQHPQKLTSVFGECEGCLMKRSSLTLSPRTPEYNVDLFFQSAGDVAASTQGCAQRCKWGKGAERKLRLIYEGVVRLKRCCYVRFLHLISPRPQLR